MIILGMPGESNEGLNADSATQGICLISLSLRTKRPMLAYLVNEAWKQFYTNLVRTAQVKEMSSMILENC